MTEQDTDNFHFTDLNQNRDVKRKQISYKQRKRIMQWKRKGGKLETERGR
jgi:hypothetical protein